MAQIPGLIRPKWYDRELLVESLSGVIPAAALIWTAYESFAKNEVAKGFSFVAALVALGVAALLKTLRASRRDSQLAKMQSPADLSGCAYVLHQLVKQELGLKNNEFRITIHRVERFPKSGDPFYEQVIPYVGGNGASIGRKWSVKAGIVGLVIRTGQPHLAERRGDDRAEFIDELVREWGYTRDEAKSLREDRRAWLGVPIYENAESKEVIGVVFADTSRTNAMNDRVQKRVVEMSKGVAKYIRWRYT